MSTPILTIPIAPGCLTRYRCRHCGGNMALEDNRLLAKGGELELTCRLCARTTLVRQQGGCLVVVERQVLRMARPR